ASRTGRVRSCQLGLGRSHRPRARSPSARFCEQNHQCQSQSSTIFETILIFSLGLMSITCREARSRCISWASSNTVSDSDRVQDQRVKNLITALSSTSGDHAATELLSFANHSAAQRDSWF